MLLFAAFCTADFKLIPLDLKGGSFNPVGGVKSDQEPSNEDNVQ